MTDENDPRHHSDPAEARPIVSPREWTKSELTGIESRFKKLEEDAARDGWDRPVLNLSEIPDSPGLYHVEFLPKLKQHAEYELIGTRRHDKGEVVDVIPEPGCEIPEKFRSGLADCKSCLDNNVPTRQYLAGIRKWTYLLRKSDGSVDPYGFDCYGKIFGYCRTKKFQKYVEGISDLKREILAPSEPKLKSPSPLARPTEIIAPKHGLPEDFRPRRGRSQIDYPPRRQAQERRPSAKQYGTPEPGAEREPQPAERASIHDSGAFRAPGGPATTAELLKFLIDRTGYIKQLEEEDTPEAYSRIENLHELVNAARDSRDRGETLDQFLDHAALVSDADQYDEHAQITLMTLHAAKGLEFPLVVLAGMEEGLFPHSRTLIEPDQIEEERRLCYVGMTRAMNTLILSRAVYRRRYGTDMPEASVPSRFLEEVPPQLVEELGGASGRSAVHGGTGVPARPAGPFDSAQGRLRPAHTAESTHYSYEDEDQSATWNPARVKTKPATPVKTYNSIDNIADFFASRGKKFKLPKLAVEEPQGKRGFRPGQKVKHPKYGEGTVYRREGDGEDAKITVQFPRFGLKKLVEKYAQLEKA